MAEVQIPPKAGNAILHWTNTVTGVSMSSTMGYQLKITGNEDPSLHAQEIMDCAGKVGSICAPASMLGFWTFTGVTTYYNEGPGLVGGISSGAAIVGASAEAGGAVNEGLSIIVRKRTARVGRRQRGRLYLPALDCTATNTGQNGQLLRLAEWNNRANAFLLAWADDAEDIIPVLLHSDPLDPPTQVTSMDVAAFVGFQRRRMR